MIRARPHVAAMEAYALADLSVPPGKRLVSLSQNESALPPSPSVFQAAAKAMTQSALYPDPDWTDLRRIIADVHGLDPDLILCGAGSMELIGTLIRAFSGPGANVVASAHSYAFFRTAARASGAEYVTATEEALTVSVDALLEAVTPETRIVCVANPGNPTGTRIGRADLVRLRNMLPGNVLLMIDEAYGEFADAPGKGTRPGENWDMIARGDTVVLRTFSKAYGLAGLRVGWGLFPPRIGAEIRKLLNPNNISLPAQAAATAAMADQRCMRATVTETAHRRAGLVADLRARGFETEDSHTNFVLIDLGTPEAAASASAALHAEGIILRAMGGYGLGHCLRVTIGATEDMARAAQVLSHWRNT